MQNQYNKLKIISSLFWKLLERTGTQGIQFIIQIILARLLLPEEYGLIAIVSVFISLANVFVQSGFNIALIQKKDADNVDFSSVFYLSLTVATLLYVIIYFSAPYIASFYRQPILVSVLRMLSITLFIGAFNSIQNAYVIRNMLFKRLFISSLGAAIVSGIVGIVMAYRDWGVWALVAQQLINQLTISIILWFSVNWRPHFLLSFERIRSLFSFGSKLLISGLIDTLYTNLNTLIIGRIYTPAMLGFYNRGQQFPQIAVININGSIQTVMLPTLSAYQDNKKRVKELTRRAILTSSFLIFPMMIGMLVVAEPLVKIVLSEKWLPSVPFLQIFCISYALMPIHTANLQAINAMGRSDIFLKLEILKKIVGLVVLGISIPFGVYAIIIGQVFCSVISTFINSYPNKQLLDYNYKEQWADIMPSLGIAIIMGSIVYLFNFINLSAWKILILQVIIGIIVYIGLSKIFKIECFSYLLITMKQLMNSRKGN